jgi:hypothetical protein
LLQDAKYDIYQAPLAWWTLASGKGKDLDEIAIPERAKDLYQVLGNDLECWPYGQPLAS